MVVDKLEIRDLAWIPPGAEETLWEKVSFELSAGELVVLRGESGSGKSTLLRGIIGLEELSDGAVFWRGKEVGADNIRLFRNRVVYIAQSPVAVAPTVGEDLAFAREMGEHFAEVEVMKEEEQRELLARFGLRDLDFTRRFDAYSVGEQQRLGIVRALTVRPEILLLDEPTASLDDENTLRVEAYIKEEFIRGGGSALWVTHGVEQQRRLGARILELNKWTKAREAV